MKKSLFYVTVVLTVLLVSCQNKEVVPDAVTLTSESTVNLSVEGDVATITFKSNVAWTAKSSQNWLTITPAQGDAGEKLTIKASAVKNEAYDAREAEVTITAGTASAKVKIFQGQTNGLEIGTTEYTVSADGGDVEVVVSANVNYEVVIPEAVDWIKVSKGKGMVDSKVVLTVDPTQEYTEEYLENWTDESIVRSANITIKSGDLSSVITIDQQTFTPYFDYTGDWAGLQWSFYDGVPTEIPQAGADIVIPVDTNIDWRVYFSVWDNDLAAMVDSWDLGWAHLSFDVDKSEIHLVIDANETFFTRENYLYAECSIDGVPDGNFGGLGQFKQPGLVPEGAEATLAWSVEFNSAIAAGYNRLAYKTKNGDALLMSDGTSIHAINPADGSYWQAINVPGIKPDNICSDDAGNVVVAEDLVADIDWGTGELLSGTEYKVYVASDVNETPKEITLPNTVYGTLGGLRARGDLATYGSIVGIAGGASYWFGYDIVEYAAAPNYYGTQNSGALAGPNTVWSPGSAAVVPVGADLHDGILYRGYDGAESLYYRHDCYTPKWAADMAGIEYEPWTLISEGGNGGNENQNNLAVVTYLGRTIVAYTQGYHFDYSGNATIYVHDVTNPEDVKTLATIDTAEWVKEVDWSGSNSADILLHPTEECLELYAVQSGKKTLAKYNIVLK